MKSTKTVFICFFLSVVSLSQTNTPPGTESGKGSLSFDLQKLELNKSLQLKTYNISDLEFDPLQTRVNYSLLYGMGALYLVAGIGVHIYQRNAWWKDDRTSFHFQNDWPYALWSDKVGHFYAATILVHAFSAGFEAANFQT